METDFGPRVLVGTVTGVDGEDGCRLLMSGSVLSLSEVTGGTLAQSGLTGPEGPWIRLFIWFRVFQPSLSRQQIRMFQTSQNL